MGYLGYIVLLTTLFLLKGDARQIPKVQDYECQTGSIDLVFVMDQSGSVGIVDYRKALNATAKMVDSLAVGYQGSHVGYVLFDDLAQVLFGLNRYYSNAEVKEAISKAPYSGGSTNIAAGMNAATKQVFTSGSRKEVLKVMIIVTDGQDTSNVEAAQSLASSLHIVTYALGVGSYTDLAELSKAAGDVNRVFLVEDYASLSKIMDEICQEIATIAPTVTPSPTVPALRHIPRGCPCNGEEDYMNIWLDIVFVVDSTNGAGHDFINIKELLITMAQYYPISQKIGKFSRIGIVNVGKEAIVVANLTKYGSGKEMQLDLDQNFQQLGGDIFYPEKGLEAAQRMLDDAERGGTRLNVEKVVVIFSTTDIDCVYDSKGKIQVKEGDNDPCRLAAHMQIDGVTLLTIAMKIPENPTPYINIATPCYNTSNSESMVETILKMLCMANCYCLPPYEQYVRNGNKCDKQGECLFVSGVSLSYSSAQSACLKEGATLSDILENEKQKFLNEFHSQAGFFPYWIGMKRENDHYIWDSWNEDATFDYSNWGKAQPDYSKGDCVYTKTSGFNITWASDKCGLMLPAHFFSCQKKSCDAQNYCDY